VVYKHTQGKLEGEFSSSSDVSWGFIPGTPSNVIQIFHVRMGAQAGFLFHKSARGGGGSLISTGGHQRFLTTAPFDQFFSKMMQKS